MSVEAMAIALHHSRATGSAKTILIGIANHVGDGGAWPALATLAKYGNVNLRNAKRAVQRLQDLGEIKIEQQKGGNETTEDYRRPNLYLFKLTCPPDCDRTTQHRTRTALSVPTAQSYPQGVSPETPGVARDTRGVSPETPKPSTNHLTKDSENNYISNRAREPQLTRCAADSADDGQHRINRKLGVCANCWEPIATLTLPNRKEGDE